MSAPVTSLRRRTLVGVLWSGLGIYGSGVLRLVSLLGLGWILPPADFGLLAVALIFLGFAEGYGELGLTSALIQQKDVDQRIFDTAFWSGLALNVGLTAATWIWAEPITSFLGDAAAAPLLRLVSFVFIVTALTVTPRAILMREMLFRHVSAAQLVGEIGFAVVGFGMARLGFGALSLGGALLAHRSLNCAVLWIGSGFRPGPTLDLLRFARLFRFGGPVALGSVLDRGLARADYFLIGRFIGTQALGFYSMALQLALLPLQRLVGSIHRVAFPAFSLVQDRPDRLKVGLLDGIRHLTVVLVPMVLAVVFLGPWLLEGIYGPKWAASIVPLRVLGAAGLFFVAQLIEASFLAVGKPRARLWLSLLRLASFLGLAVAFGLARGIGGIAASLFGALALWAAAFAWLAMRSFGIRPIEIGAALWPAMRAGLAALAPLALGLLLPAPALSPWTRLVVGGVAMTAIYLALALPPYRASIAARMRDLLQSPGVPRLLRRAAGPRSPDPPPGPPPSR